MTELLSRHFIVMTDARVIELQTRAQKQSLRLELLLHNIKRQRVPYVPVRIQRAVSAYTSIESTLPLLRDMDPYFQTSSSTPLSSNLLPQNTYAVNINVQTVLHNNGLFQCKVTLQQQGHEKVNVRLRYQKLKGNTVQNTIIVPWNMRKLQTLQVFIQKDESCCGGNVLCFSLTGAFFQKNVFLQT